MSSIRHERFLASVKKEKRFEYYRWRHDKCYRDIHLSTCIYCKRVNIPCFHSQDNNSSILSFCKDCIDSMFELSEETKEEKTLRLQKEITEMEEKLAKMPELKAIEKSTRKVNKTNLKTNLKTKKQELASLQSTTTATNDELG